MDQKLEDLEKACIRQAEVSPYWLPGGDAFWYMRESEPGKSRFIFVDCVAGLRQEAFDHAGLAAELGK
jgi:dipeptidyl-peptidase 4